MMPFRGDYSGYNGTEYRESLQRSNEMMHMEWSRWNSAKTRSLAHVEVFIIKRMQLADSDIFSST